MIENSREKKNELHTEPPIIEKDEVKQAEEAKTKAPLKTEARVMHFKWEANDTSGREL